MSSPIVCFGCAATFPSFLPSFTPPHRMAGLTDAQAATKSLAEIETIADSIAQQRAQVCCMNWRAVQFKRCCAHRLWSMTGGATPTGRDFGTSHTSLSRQVCVRVSVCVCVCLSVCLSVSLCQRGCVFVLFARVRAFACIHLHVHASADKVWVNMGSTVFLKLSRQNAQRLIESGL